MKTNYQRITEMSVDEMIELFDGNCQLCEFFKDDDCWEQDCKVGHKQWLLAESE